MNRHDKPTSRVQTALPACIQVASTLPQVARGRFLTTSKAATGIVGLHDILAGGLSRSHVYLLEGEPGTGKTTVALQFLLAGVQAGERSLYITLSETEHELREGALSHGWELKESIKIYELTPPESLLDEQHQQSLLY